MSTCDYWKPIPDGGIALPCSCGDDCDGTEVDRDLARLEVLSEFPHNPLGPVRMHRLADEIVRLREALTAATRVTITDTMREQGARALCLAFRMTHRDGEQYAPYDHCAEEGKNVWRGLANTTLHAALTAALEGPRDNGD